MKVLGIDPGSRSTGFGIVEFLGGRFTATGFGCLRARADASLALRLDRIFRGLIDLVDAHRPDVLAVERIFHAVNAASALQLGHSRGVAVLVGGHRGLPVFEYTALEVKKAVTGYGRATKDQVQAMVRRLIGLQGTMGSDASDALAVALCHLQSDPLRCRLENEEVAGRALRGGRKRFRRSASVSPHRERRP